MKSTPAKGGRSQTAQTTPVNSPRLADMQNFRVGMLQTAWHVNSPWYTSMQQLSALNVTCFVFDMQERLDNLEIVISGKVRVAANAHTCE